MSSGVTVHDECKTMYDEIQKKKMHRFLVLKIKDEKEITVECVGERGASYADFIEKMTCSSDPKCLCRYGVYDYEYQHSVQGASESVTKNKILCLRWCPENGVIKDKMLYTSSEASLKNVLCGVNKYIQATDQSEISEETVREKLLSTDRT